MAKNSKDILRKAALDYHAQPKPGKLEIRAQSQWPMGVTWLELILLV